MKASLTTALRQGYIEARDNREDRLTAWKYNAACAEEKRPFVRVTPRVTLGAVILDMEPSGRRLSAAGIEAVKGAILATRGGPSLGGYRYGNYTHVSGLYLADCHNLALALLKIATTEAYLEAAGEGASHG